MELAVKSNPLSAAAFLAAMALAALAACSGSDTPSSPRTVNACDSSGASATISAGDRLRFTGASTINAGESVCWQNTGVAPHTVTDDNGTFNDALPSGGMVVKTFATPGVFSYHCNIHPGMAGTITVR